MSKPPKKLVWAGAKYGAPKETLERAAAMYGALRALSGEDPSVSKPLAMLYGLGGLYDLEADDTRKRDELADAARTEPTARVRAFLRFLEPSGHASQ